jgi:hypothetical protein
MEHSPSSDRSPMRLNGARITSVFVSIEVVHNTVQREEQTD